jgi:hypothetical protein
MPAGSPRVNATTGLLGKFGVSIVSSIFWGEVTQLSELRTGRRFKIHWLR